MAMPRPRFSVNAGSASAISIIIPNVFLAARAGMGFKTEARAWFRSAGEARPFGMDC